MEVSKPIKVLLICVLLFVLFILIVRGCGNQSNNDGSTDETKIEESATTPSDEGSSATDTPIEESPSDVYHLEDYVGVYKKVGSTTRNWSQVTLSYVDETRLFIEHEAEITYRMHSLCWDGINVTFENGVGTAYSDSSSYTNDPFYFYIILNQDGSFELKSDEELINETFGGVYKLDNGLTEEDVDNQKLEDEELEKVTLSWFIQNSGYWQMEKDSIHPAASLQFYEGNRVEYWIEGMQEPKATSFTINGDEISIEGMTNIVMRFTSGEGDEEEKHIRLDGDNDLSGWYLLEE